LYLPERVDSRFYVIQPLNESSLLSIVLRIYLLPLMVGLFFPHAPLTAVISEKEYWTALRDRFPVAVTSLNFTLVGLLPVTGILLIVCETTLDLRGPGSVLFWGIMAMGSLAGLLVVYPFSVRMARRGFGCWPHSAYPDGGTTGRKAENIPPTPPGIPWSFLLMSFALMSGTIGLILLFLL